MSLTAYRPREPLPKRSRQPGERGEIVAAATLSSKSTMPVGFIMIFGWPQMASWAVPKGPSMNPADKRLAVRTEDHPLEYAKFEGVIPPGQYEAGTVMVCDLGKYESPEDRPPEEQPASGKVHVVLQGEKLCGLFTLIKLERQSKNSSRRDYWLLIKSRDEYADPSWDIESPRFDYSVLTGRTLEEIRDGKPIKRRSARRRV
jgi:bifunctional non-homologous end joining protein LigD